MRFSSREGLRWVLRMWNFLVSLGCLGSDLPDFDFELLLPPPLSTIFLDRALNKLN